MPRTRLSAVLYLILVFGSGILVGVASTRLYAVKASVPATTAPRNMDELRARYVNEMRQKIGITDAQAASVTSILDETKKKYDDLRRQQRPQRDQIQQEQVDAVRATLTEAQKPAFDAWRAERLKAQQSRQGRTKNNTSSTETK